jgi:hypothetical protein
MFPLGLYTAPLFFSNHLTFRILLLPLTWCAYGSSASWHWERTGAILREELVHTLCRVLPCWIYSTNCRQEVFSEAHQRSVR